MFDLRSLELEPGAVRREQLAADVEPLTLGGQTYTVEPRPLEVRLELQPGNGGLYLKLRFDAAVHGPCMRCLEPARMAVSVDAREYHDPSPGAAGHEELVSDYLAGEELDVERWVRDSIAEALPEVIICAEDCAGLCPRCGIRLEAGALHDCGQEEPDSRWEKLRELL